MLRSDHRIMIEQGEESHYAVLRLLDKQETQDGSLVTGIWKHTSETYNDTEIKFTSDNPQYFYWEWRGPHSGTLSLGVKMGRASHRDDEKEIFQILITLYQVRRTAMGYFEIASVIKPGAGKLTYNVNPHFTAGDILWTPVRYESRANE